MLRRILISSAGAKNHLREAQMIDWLHNIDAVAGIDPVPASADASFRRYFRLQTASGSFIVMDAPPEQEDSTSFLRIAAILEAMQLNAPRIVEADIEQGFMLLSDLGAAQYLDVLSKTPALAEELYDDAMQALLLLQQRGTAYQGTLPPYDDKLLQLELSLFRDWLCETHLKIKFTDAEQQQWQSVCDLLAANALDQPQVFVHRDYHSRNLMYTDHDNPGILDFQDAVEGPYTYDLASLLKDCYLRWPEAQVRDWVHRFYAQLDDEVQQHSDIETFTRHFELMAAQRHLKAAGIFARLNHRDGKPGYMADVPRTLRYIVDIGPYYQELDFLVNLIKERCLPVLEKSG